MTRTKKIILSILILLFVLGVSGGVVYFFYFSPSSVQKRSLEEISQGEVNPQHTAPYLKNETYLATLAAFDQSDHEKDPDSQAQQILFDSLMQFNNHQQVTYSYVMRPFEGYQEVQLKGGFDQERQLFYEQVTYPDHQQLIYYQQGTLHTLSSYGPENSFDQEGSIQEMILPQALFLDYLVTFKESQDLVLKDQGSTYQLEGDLGQEFSSYLYGHWTLEVDKDSHQVVALQVNQAGNLVLDIQRLDYSDQAGPSEQEIEDLVTSLS